MLLSDALQEFGPYSRHELGHSPQTNLCYLSRLRQFSRWLEEQGHRDPPIHTISPDLVRRYSFWLSGQMVRPRTIRRALHALRSFFSYWTGAGVRAKTQR
jgi:site-specific recombinase XerD